MISNLGVFLFLCALFFFALVGAGARLFMSFMEIQRIPSFRMRGAVSGLMTMMFAFSIGGGLAIFFIVVGIIRPLLHLSNTWSAIIIPVEILIGWFVMRQWAHRQIERENESRLSQGRRDTSSDETAAEVAKRIVGNRTF
jgi:hypothetical protein